METKELFFTAFVAILAVHVYYFYKFTKSKNDKTTFDLMYWIKDNWADWTLSLGCMILIMVMVDWGKLSEFYADKVLDNYPILEVFKPHAVIAFISAFFGTGIIRMVIKKGNEKIKTGVNN